jgi:hypothetical protein
MPPPEDEKAVKSRTTARHFHFYPPFLVNLFSTRLTDGDMDAVAEGRGGGVRRGEREERQRRDLAGSGGTAEEGQGRFVGVEASEDKRVAGEEREDKRVVGTDDLADHDQERVVKLRVPEEQQKFGNSGRTTRTR